jgi:outer membrane receptor for ferrienterochelin and colicins
VKKVSILIFILGLTRLWAQDSLQTKKLEEVVVTATRNDHPVASLPMPVSIVSKSQIQTMGSLRLNNVLTEQTGLVIVPQVNGVGNGLQMQGFDPDYTLILVDGEPLIGRFTGSLDLSRITVGNIKQIEIVKGPSSSLYGSDALAGVVNIITDGAAARGGTFSARYGTFNTTNFNADMGTKEKKWSSFVSFNRYGTDGYSMGASTNKIVSPFTNNTLSGKFSAKLSPSTLLKFSGRWFEENQQQNFLVNAGVNQMLRTIGQGKIKDWNMIGTLVQRVSSRLKATARFYSTRYSTQTSLNIQPADTLYYHDDFAQGFTRPELVVEYFANSKNIFTAGAGAVFESVQTSRYGDESPRHQQTDYSFLQHEWLPQEKFHLITGARWDRNSIYGSQLSPKISALWQVNEAVSLKASYGLGFKAPDFRQLYLNFNNTAAGGYSVLGTEIVEQRIRQLQAQGQIGSLFYNLDQLGKLEAERSRALNVGGKVLLNKKWWADVNIFRNDIDNLIETQIVANTVASQNIYSYRNLKRVFTQGLELNVTYAVTRYVSAQAGYQLLYAKDKDVMANIESGGVYSYYRDPVTLETKRLTISEYFGLSNRSRHTGNFKLFYKNPNSGWEASLRTIYRGKYGAGSLQGNVQGISIPPSDRNNNGILDVYDNFVKGYLLFNFSVAKTFKDKFRVQAGVDNLLNYTDPMYIPNLPGRQLYLSLAYSFRAIPHER